MLRFVCTFDDSQRVTCLLLGRELFSYRIPRSVPEPLPPPAVVIVDKPAVLGRTTLRRRTMKAEMKAMKERIQDDEWQLV